MVWLKTKKYLWLVLNWKWLWPCCFGICPMSAGRKVQNMSPFCRQKGTEFVHSLPAERGHGLLFRSTPLWWYGHSCHSDVSCPCNYLIRVNLKNNDIWTSFLFPLMLRDLIIVIRLFLHSLPSNSSPVNLFFIFLLWVS